MKYYVDRADKMLKEINKNPKILLQTFEELDMPIFTFKGKGINSNISAIRQYDKGKPTPPGFFDDLIINIYETARGWKTEIVPASTDASKLYFLHPITSWGTVIFCEGFHQGCFSMCGKGWKSQNEWGIRGHGSTRIEAMRLMKPVWTIRDKNRDSVIDLFLNTPKEELIKKGILAKRNVGTNLHPSISNKSKYSKVTHTSAGCQVMPLRYFNEWIKNVKQSAYDFGNSFSYKLINSDNLLNNINI